MWVYMISCYVMSLVTFMLLVTGFFQSILRFPVFEAGHLLFMILTSIVYCFTETLIIFFFVGTGMGIKEFAIDHQLDPQFHRRSIALKRKVFPPLLLNILFMMILFILGGAVDTHRLPTWAYRIIFLGCIFHFGKTKRVEHENAKEITQIVREMSGVKGR